MLLSTENETKAKPSCPFVQHIILQKQNENAKHSHRTDRSFSGLK